jgi:hypothetical protein
VGDPFGDIEDTFLARSGSVVEGLLWLCLWGCGHRVRGFAAWTGGRGDVHKSTGCCGIGAKIDRADGVSAKMNAEDAVFGGRTKRNTLAAKRLAQTNAIIPEADVAHADQSPSTPAKASKMSSCQTLPEIWQVSSMSPNGPPKVSSMSPVHTGLGGGGSTRVQRAAGWRWRATAARPARACRCQPSAGRATRRCGNWKPR